MSELRNKHSRFAKAGVWCFYESEVLNSSFVHLMKFSAKNPHLRQARNRYASIQVQCRLTVLCSEARPNAKPKTVSSQFRERHQNNKMKLKIMATLREDINHSRLDSKSI